MINVSRFTCIRKEEIFIITGMEDQPSPCCRDKLSVHGTCKRKLKAFGGTAVMRLRVMECKCGKTHREMPDGIIPYERYSAEMLCAIFSEGSPVDCIDNAEEKPIDDILFPMKEEYACDAGMCDKSVRQRIVEWISWFLAYVESIEELRSSLKDTYNSLCSKLRHYVSVVVNSGRWKQHRFAMPSV